MKTPKTTQMSEKMTTKNPSETSSSDAKKKTQNEKGIFFETLCRRSKMTFSAIAREIGVITPQQMNNWRWRGVPSKYALITASILDCVPTDISDIQLDEEVENHLFYRRRDCQSRMEALIKSADDATLDLFEAAITFVGTPRRLR